MIKQFFSWKATKDTPYNLLINTPMFLDDSGYDINGVKCIDKKYLLEKLSYYILYDTDKKEVIGTNNYLVSKQFGITLNPELLVGRG